MSAIERAGQAAADERGADFESCRWEFSSIARAAFASIDVDELARVIEDADDALLAAGRVPATYLHPEAHQEIARRVKAWLVGEES